MSSPPASRHATTFSSVGWQIIAPVAALFVFLVAGLLFLATRTILPEARALDFARLERQLQSAATLASGAPPPASTAELHAHLAAAGLEGATILPATATPRGRNPRYITPGSFVQGWTTYRNAGDSPAGIILLKLPAESARQALHVLRLATMAAALLFVLLTLIAWLAFHRCFLRPVRDTALGLLDRVPEANVPETAEPLQLLHQAATAAAGAADRQMEQHRMLLDRHTEMACLGTPDGTLLEVNTAYCRFFGKTREDLVGTNYLDLIPPADRTDAVANLRRLSARHPEAVIEHRLLHPDGSTRWTRWRDTAVFDADGNITAALSLGTDISAEKALREDLDNLGSAFHQMQSLARTGTLTWDLSAGTMQWTDETYRLLGLDPGQTPASLDALLAVVDPADRRQLDDHFRRAREQGRPFEQEFRVHAGPQTIRHLQSRAEVRADPQTKLLDQLTCTLRDITDLRDAEAAQRRELRFRTAVERSLAAGVVVHDDQGVILSVNPFFREMTGWREEELVGRQAPYPYWPEEELPAIDAAFRQAIVGQTPPEGFHWKFRRRDGSRFDVLFKVAPLLDTQGRLGWLGAVTDITAIQQVRRELTVTNDRLQIAQSVVEFGIWDWDPQQDKLFWDRQSFALFGHPHATDANDIWARALPAQEAARLTRELRGLIASGGSSGHDLIHARWPDGSVHEISSTYLILRDDHGTAIRVFGVNRDITNELEAERELRDAHQRLTAALEGGHFGTFEHLIGRGDYNWNLANYEINGIDPAITDPAELFQAWKNVTGEFLPQLMATMNALPATRTHHTYEFTARPAGLEPRHVRVSVFIERNPQGHPTRLVGITRRLD